MHPPRAQHKNSSSNKLPFTVDSIKQYQPFQMLEPKVKAKICELLANGEVSLKGNIKRPPNSFMLYRRDRLSGSSDHKGSSPESASKPKPSMVQSEWNKSHIRKAEYNKLARNARREHNAKYPGYKYAPIPERKWRAIDEDGRRKWFFDALSLVGKNIVQEHSRNQFGSLDIDEWIRDPANHSYVNDQILEEVLSNAKSKTRTSCDSRGRRSTIQTTESLPSDNDVQLNNDWNINDHNAPREHVNTTLPPLMEATIYPQSLFMPESPLVPYSNRTPTLVDEAPPWEDHGEQGLWDINDPESYFLQIQNYYDSMNQDGVFSPDLANSTEEYNDCSELMKEFLNPAMLEDMDES